MDTQALHAFVEVAQSASFSQAAERLHLTQPAISKRIAALESQLDCKLFDRVGRRVRLTPAGSALLPQAERILLAVNAAKHSIHDLKGGVSGPLQMGISHHIGLHRLPPVLKSFSKRYPDARLDIDFLDSEQACQRVLHGSLDLAVITLDRNARPPLKQTTIWKDELVFTAAPDHPLAQRRLSLSTLSEYDAILPGLNTYTGQIVSALFAEHELPLRISMSTHYLETIKMMVSIGLGWSVLPRTLIDKKLTILPLKGVALSRELGYVVHDSRSLTNAARAFIQLLDERAK